MKIEFQEKDHSYKIDGAKAVGVNELLHSFGIGYLSFIPERILEPARQFGHAGHLMARYHLEGRLNEKTLDPKLFPYLFGLKKLFIDHKIEIIDVEKMIGYDTLLVCGRPDLLCTFDGHLMFLDWKFVKNVMKHVHLLMGGYRYIYNSKIKEVEDRVHPGKAIKLIPNGYEIFDEGFDSADQFGTLLLAHHIRRDYL